MEFPKISVVTVSLNSEKYIEECICSVLDQNYPNLEYIIVDGVSADSTLSIINKYANKINIVISEPDSGPADAINKGFASSTGEIMCWLNSDDRMQIFNSFPRAEWLMGFPTWFKSNGTCVNESYYQREKFYYTNKFISDNLHFKFARWSKWRFVMGDFSAIQQESVFWRRSLWQKAGSHLKGNTIAHDLELWTRFFELADLYTTNVVLAGFRVHGNQLSVINRARYKAQSEIFINKFKSKILHRGFWGNIRIQMASMTKVFYYYEIPWLKNLYPFLLELPPYILFDFVDKKFKTSVDGD